MLRAGAIAAVLGVVLSAPIESRAADADIRVTATFEQRPLGEVLERLGRDRSLVVSGPRAVLSMPVTHRFDGVEWREAVATVLDAFDHAIVDGGEEAGPVRLVVLGAKRRAAKASAPRASAALVAAPGATISECERALFANVDPHPELSPELAAAFDPEQPPGTELTGPVPETPIESPVESAEFPGMPAGAAPEAGPPGGLPQDGPDRQAPIVGFTPIANTTEPLPEQAVD